MSIAGYAGLSAEVEPLASDCEAYVHDVAACDELASALGYVVAEIPSVSAGASPPVVDAATQEVLAQKDLVDQATEDLNAAADTVSSAILSQAEEDYEKAMSALSDAVERGEVQFVSSAGQADDDAPSEALRRAIDAAVPLLEREKPESPEELRSETLALTVASTEIDTRVTAVIEAVVPVSDSFPAE